MPKMKTHSGAAKRFKRTAGGKGKLRRGQAGMNHILEKKPSKRTRRLAGDAPLSPGDEARMNRLLGRR